MEKVTLNSLVHNIVPDYVLEQYPLLIEFLREYYKSQETSGNSLDIIQNLSDYVNIDNITNLIESTSLYSNVTYYDKEIYVDSIRGFSSNQGLVKIGSEVIYYENAISLPDVDFLARIEPGLKELNSLEAEDLNTLLGWYVKVYNLSGKLISEGKIVSLAEGGNSVNVDFTPIVSDEIDGYERSELYRCVVKRSKFSDCKRGFSAITGLRNNKDTNRLIFEETNASKHVVGDKVLNLNIILLKEFFNKIKVQISPGFENETFYSTLNESTFVKNIRQFYLAKGSECSFDLLFKAIFGKPVDIVIPSNNLIEPSSSRYTITKNVVVELLEGDIESLQNRTLYQDEQFNIPQTRGIITKVETLQRDDKNFYTLYIDSSVEENYDSTYGNFTIHPKTKNIQKISKLQNFIDVDSTIGFPLSGTLIIKDVDGFDRKIQYGSKTSTQFLNCTNVLYDFELGSDVYLDVFAYVRTSKNPTKVRITGVLDNDINLSNLGIKYLKKGDVLPYKTLGIDLENDPRTNCWIYNISKDYDVKSIVLVDEKDFTYTVVLYDKHDFSVGQGIKLFPNIGFVTFNGNVIEYINEYSVSVRGTRVLLDPNVKYTLQKKVNKSNFNGITSYPSDVQNTYYDKETKDVYVNSQSLPLYRPSFEVEELNVNKRTRSFSGNFDNDTLIDIGKHGFYTGDAVVYKPRVIAYVPKYVIESNGVTSYKFINPENGEYENNPTLTLIRGKTYTFSNFTGIHPLRIQEERNGVISDQYNNGIKNNDVSNGILYWEVQEDTPDVLYYQCLKHLSMGGVINIIDESQQQNLNINKGIYYVKRITDRTIQLYSSRSNIYTNKPVLLTGTVNGDTIESYDYTYKNFDTRNIDPQDIIRKIPLSPKHNHTNNSMMRKMTKPGTTGIWRNGIEVLNYKSKDFFKYGKIESVDILSKGSGYDVINIPAIKITDLKGSGCSATASVKGYLKSIEVIDSGFDYKDVPVIKISGGNGFGASVKVNLEKYEHYSVFDSSSIDVSSDIIGFSTYHKFKNGELVKYDPQGQKAVGGITTSGYYYVSIVDPWNIKLHRSEKSASSGIGTINLSQFGIGKHKLISSTKKNRVKNIEVLNRGSGYETKFRSCSSSGISTFKNTITINNHGYESGEIVSYNPTVSPVSGLSSSTDYYVLKVDNNSFRLCEISGISTQKDIFYKQKKYIRFSGSPTGEHNFKYQDIEVTIEGRSSLNFTDLNAETGAVIRPIFSGEIDSIFVKDGGSKYGSDIINFDSQPNIEILQGRNARLKPVVSEGKIVTVIIENPGKDYYSIPEINVIGSGVQAVLLPVIENGFIVDVIIQNPGIGYSKDSTKLVVSNRGKNASLRANIQKWTINLVEKYINSQLVSPEDAFLYEGKDKRRGIEFVHTYAPRKLRQISLAQRFLNGQVTYNPDLELINGTESESLSHSPILGWAYDGNPIYGPYGFSSRTGGKIIQMKSGYSLRSDLNKDKNRLDLNLYPAGFFIEDYIFNDSGDLDVHNGRYTITPEYPNGTYAYFCTLNTFSDTNGPFKSYKKPSFPYVIGNYYVSDPIDFNFSPFSNLSDYNLDNSNLLRNTNPYNFDYKNTRYPYLKYDRSYRNQNAIVKSTTFGNINSIGIVTGGFDYKVGDRVVFESQIDSFRAKAEVSKVRGEEVSSIEVISDDTKTCDIIKVNNRFVGFTSDPHGFTNREVLSLSFNNNKLTTSPIKVDYNIVTLKESLPEVSSTGIVTYISVITNFENIYADDVYESNGEKFKVLKIDSPNSRLLVQREYLNSIGTSHVLSSGLVEDSRRFELSIQNSFVTEFTNKYQNSIYIEPSLDVGIGTITINITNHNLNTGDILDYSFEGGSSIISNGFSLSDAPEIFVSRINSNTIGLTTTLSGISTNPQLLVFDSVGIGSVHKFTPIYQNKLRCNIFDDRIKVTTTTPHGLNVGDSFEVKVVSGITTTFKVEYNRENRRVIIGRRDFPSSDVNVLENYITLPNHKFYSGQVVIYKTNSILPTGLINNQIYYVSVINKDRIKLCQTQYDANIGLNAVNITDAVSGSILPVNPPLEIYQYSEVVFDLSDSSLSINELRSRESFDFRLYWDHHLMHEYFTSATRKEFNVLYQGSIGVSSDASVRLRNVKDLPSELYYNLSPRNVFGNDKEVVELFVDTQANTGGYHHNSINMLESKFNGKYVVNDVTLTSFSAPLVKNPEFSKYQKQTGTSIEYYLDTKNASGKIADVKIQSYGEGYKKIPKIIDISSENGYGAILKVNSDNIGQPVNIDFDNIGFDYYSDNTLRPTSQVPTILELDYKSSVESIEVINPGKRYSLPPDIIVIDGFTNKVLDDLEFSYDIVRRKVDIIKNTYNISEYPSRILTINNTNGIGINTITYNNENKHVTVEINSSYSTLNEFPFNIGDKFLIENVSVGVGTTGKGYNSENYNYTLFEVIDSDPKLGGVGATVTYSLEGLINVDEYPGDYNVFNSSGKIVPESYLPQFKLTKFKTKFLPQEEVISELGSRGKILSIDYERDLIRISTFDKFNIGDDLKGLTSGRRSKVINAIDSEIEFPVSAGSIVRNGWSTKKGFLNDDTQRIHDSDYYQYFSYSVKSEVDYERWNPYVKNLTHTVGFKRFSDLLVPSEPEEFIGINTEQNSGNISGIADIYQVVDIDCYSDFDTSTESLRVINESRKSKEIQLKSKLLQDYVESIGNRVLSIDDISPQFNQEIRATRYSDIDSYTRTVGFRKYFVVVENIDNPVERQSGIVLLLSDGLNVFNVDYGKTIPKNNDLGDFDAEISGTDVILRFFPDEYKISNYYVFATSLELDTNIIGVGSLPILGDAVSMYSEQKHNIGIGNTEILRLPLSNTSNKLIIHVSADNGYVQTDEIIITSDGNDIYLNEYGFLNSSGGSSNSTPGIATFSYSIDGSEIVVLTDIDTPNATSFNVDTSVTTFSSNAIGVGTASINGALLETSYKSISSSPSPSAVGISSFGPRYDAAYVLASVQDLTNGTHFYTEFVVMSSWNKSIEYVNGMVASGTDIGIGTFGASSDGSFCTIEFTPEPDINVDVRMFQFNIGYYDDLIEPEEIIDLGNMKIDSGWGEYVGTDLSIRKSFDLYHKEQPLFQKIVNPTLQETFNFDDNILNVPGHYFVTGEELDYKYRFSDFSSDNAISIASTTVPGIGVTDKLPTTVYAVRVDNLSIKLAATAEDALAFTPKVFEFTSLGITTDHYLTCKKQNTRALISLDNIIQAPVVSSSTTSTLAIESTPFNAILEFSDVSGFAGGDLVQIDDEIMRIFVIGFNDNPNNVYTTRGFIGTKRASHSSGSIVTKVTANYNIVDNTVYFPEAPFGNVQFENPLNKPDEVDYFGLDVRSKFNGRVFMRSSQEGGSQDPYYNNFILDTISDKFTGFDTDFVLKSFGGNITGIASQHAAILINNVFQIPTATFVDGNYDMLENGGETTIKFVGYNTSRYYDINMSGLPRGGMILSIGSSEGLGYQPLVSAGGTAIISPSGSISNISIGNSGSGYRSGIQTSIKIGIKTESLSKHVEYIGFATSYNGSIVSIAITNPGTGYTASNPPIVVFDDPFPYHNIPLQYQPPYTGVGTEAYIDLVVGNDSSVISYEIKNYGYGFAIRDILTLPTGGETGIPTTSEYGSFENFSIIVDSVYTDDFSGWHFGELQPIDSINNLIDGVRRFFPISIDGQQTTIRSKQGSEIDVQSTLLVFVNDILQVPGEGYVFENGSIIEFPNPLEVGSKVSILFYRGSGDIDTKDVNILEPVEKGDMLIIESDDPLYEQNQRQISDIVNTNTVETNAYSGPGLDKSESIIRPIKLCLQKNDISVNGEYIGKSRSIYEPYILPVARLIHPVDVNSTDVYVDNVKICFDDLREYSENKSLQQSISIVSQDILVSAAATAVVSAAGTISSIVFSNTGLGYTSGPRVIVPNPPVSSFIDQNDFYTNQTIITTTVSNGSIDSFNIISSGTGYTSTNPPYVIIDPPVSVAEDIVNVTYKGDFGHIVRINKSNSTTMDFDLFVPPDSYLRNIDVSVGIATTGLSSIETGDYFVVRDTNIGNGVISKDSLGSVVSIGNSFIDNVYIVVAKTTSQLDIPGIGITDVTRVEVKIDSSNTVPLGITTGFCGTYSWGKISNLGRRLPKSFNVPTGRLSGINTSPVIMRKNRLDFKSYL